MTPLMEVCKVELQDLQDPWNVFELILEGMHIGGKRVIAVNAQH